MTACVIDMGAILIYLALVTVIDNYYGIQRGMSIYRKRGDLRQSADRSRGRQKPSERAIVCDEVYLRHPRTGKNTGRVHILPVPHATVPDKVMLQ